MSLISIKTKTNGDEDRYRKTSQGIIFKKNLGNYAVHSNGRIISCVLSSRLRKEFDYPLANPNSLRHVVKNVKEVEHIDPVAIGDQVMFIETSENTGMIMEILPRRNRLSRKTAVPMPGAHAFEQVIVANIDQVVPVFSAANPAPKWNMLDRYLVAAESFEIHAVICITKLDLVQTKNGNLETELTAAVEDYRRIGYPVVMVSAHTGHGMGELKEKLHGRISVFVGKSGVGKSSLLNILQPGLGLKVKEVSQASGKGRHTTSHLEMFPLKIDVAGDSGSNGAIVDTPGTREFGLWDVADDDLAYYFPEMRPFLGACRFGLNCQHNEEPGCAIRKAVTADKISPRRYQSYLRLRDDSK